MIDEHWEYLVQIKQEKSLIKQNLSDRKNILVDVEKKRGQLLIAQKRISDLFIECSKEAKVTIETIINLALRTIFGDTYRFELDYQIKRNQVEAEPILFKHGQARNLRDECGEGVVDIISFAFRLAIWAMRQPDEKAYTFVLDEPFKSISEENEPLAAQMMKETFASLGIQGLITTHSQTFVDYIDTGYLIRERGKGLGSIIEKIK